MSSRGLAVLDRSTIAELLGSGRRLSRAGAMGIHASDGLSGKVAAARTRHFVGVGTISGVLKTPSCFAPRSGAPGPRHPAGTSAST